MCRTAGHLAHGGFDGQGPHNHVPLRIDDYSVAPPFVQPKELGRPWHRILHNTAELRYNPGTEHEFMLR